MASERVIRLFLNEDKKNASWMSNSISLDIHCQMNTILLYKLIKIGNYKTIKILE